VLNGSSVRPMGQNRGRARDFPAGLLQITDMRRLLTRLLSLWRPGARGRTRSAKHDGLTAVEYEAVTIIAYEGRKAYARACEQARYCRQNGSVEGFQFWSEVAGEVRRRTRGRMPEER
jgi:hypothetical protein